MTVTDSFLRFLAPLARPIYGGQGLILMYHRVLPEDRRPRLPGHSVLEVTPEQLEASLRYFAKRKYLPLSPEGLYQVLRGEVKLDRPFVLFTFDDGYIDNLTHAYPVFKKHDVPFTINVTTGFPDRKTIIWWYLLEDLVLSRERINFEHAGQHLEFDCTTPVAKAAAFARLRRMLKYANAQTYPQLIQAIFTGLDPYRRTDELALTWDQVKQLASDPLVTISAHTCGHYVLGKLKEEEARQEIQDSKRILEDRLGRPVDHFAYPFGFSNEAGEREFRLAAECGFKTAMTTRYGNIFPAHRDRTMALPRYDMSRTPQPGQLDMVASGALSMRMNRFRKIAA